MNGGYSVSDLMSLLPGGRAAETVFFVLHLLGLAVCLRMRVLLIEDERKVADFVARGLRSERFAVDTAYDAPSGWEMASGVDYDVIILDLMLPGFSGTELLRRLRRNHRTAAVLILTARDAPHD